MKKKTILVILFCSIFSFCSKIKEEKNLSKEEDVVANEEESISPAGIYLSYLTDTEKMNKLRKRMNIGDTTAYHETREIYLLSGQDGGFLIHAINMANNASFATAYYDVYNYLHSINNNHLDSSEYVEVGLSKLDSETRNMAFSYLKKAASMGHKKAIEELKKYDSKGNLKQ